LTQVKIQAADGAVDATAAGPPAYTITDIGRIGDIASASVWVGDSGLVVGASQETPAFEWVPTTSNGTIGHAKSLDVFGSPLVIPSG